MSRTRTSTCFSLGEPGGDWGRALLGSVVLHGALLFGLVSLKHTIEPSDTTTPSVLLVDLVYLHDAGSEAGGRVPEATVAGVDPAPIERTAVETDTLELEPARAVAAPPPAPTPPELRPAPEPARTRPPPTTVVVEPPATSPAPVEATKPRVEPTLAVREPSRASDLPDTGGNVAPQPEPELTAIGDEERQMLDDRLAAWSEHMDELGDEAVSWEHEGQAYSATFTRLTDDDSMGIEHVLVAVTTEQDGQRWSTAMRMKRLAFSSFAQFVDRWDENVQIHDDEIDGRFHANSDIYIANSGGIQPAFHGKVTTARRINTSNSTRRVRREEVFLGGLETRVPRIALPRDFLPFPTEGEVAARNVQRFEHSTRIVFNADGSYVWRTLDARGADDTEQRRMLGDEPFYLVGAEGASLHVRGVVHGKVLVYSPEDIVIEADLVYAADPSSVPASGDYVGLVAARNVVIAGPDMTGPGDLTVQAAIYARRRFQVRNYTRRGPATLHVYGSVAAGALSATEPRYRTKLEFDRRLEAARPPGFPMTDRYELAAWDGLWMADPVP